jgi:hypothetical protein
VVKSRGDLLDLEHQKDRLGQNPSNYMLFNIYIFMYIYKHTKTVVKLRLTILGETICSTVSRFGVYPTS